MLINFSNHPSKNWSLKQTEAAFESYGKIVDIEFPKINPNADDNEIERLSEKYLHLCVDKLKSVNGDNNAVHVMGELTFTFALVAKLLKRNIVCVASTTERNSFENGGKKISEFKFVRFREYKM